MVLLGYLGAGVVLAALLLSANASAADARRWRIDDADYYSYGDIDDPRVRLGQLLFFDKILSGNRNISCASCHHPFAATADGLSLPVGEGGQGLSVTRDTGTGAGAIAERVPRNAPGLFNVGARQFELMFHDGRVAADERAPSGFATPAGDQLPVGLDNVLAAQAMFPVASAVEMAGRPGSNPVADAAAVDDLGGTNGVWAQLSQRVAAIEGYLPLFRDAYRDVADGAEIDFVHIANAVAAFQTVAFRSDASPFDRYLRGDRRAMSQKARHGMQLFYRKARCSECHAGPLQTDHGFHAIAMPQIGPGKGDGADGHEDFGREGVTGRQEDRYRFRTPSLRNVALTGPWGHAGAFDSLREAVLHHLDPSASWKNYDPRSAVMPPREDLDADDFAVVLDSARAAAIVATHELPKVRLSEWQVDALLEFLDALTDPATLDLRWCVPASVPSGLPVWD